MFYMLYDNKKLKPLTVSSSDGAIVPKHAIWIQFKSYTLRSSGIVICFGGGRYISSGLQQYGSMVGSQTLKKLYCQKQGVGSFLAVHLQVNSIVFQSTRESRLHAGECMAISLIKLKNATMNQILEEE